MPNKDFFREDNINLIQKLNLDPYIKQNIVSFIETYDGTHEKDFKLLILSIIDMIAQMEILDIKARGYDRLYEMSTVADDKIKDIISELDDITSNLKPPITS